MGPCRGNYYNLLYRLHGAERLQFSPSGLTNRAMATHLRCLSLNLHHPTESSATSSARPDQTLGITKVCPPVTQSMRRPELPAEPIKGVGPGAVRLSRGCRERGGAGGCQVEHRLGRAGSGMLTRRVQTCLLFCLLRTFSYVAHTQLKPTRLRFLSAGINAMGHDS